MPVRLYNTSAVRISITPVNEYPPRFTHRNSSRFNIQENLPVPNGLVLIDVNATDKDYGPQGNRYVPSCQERSFHSKVHISFPRPQFSLLGHQQNTRESLQAC